MTYPECVQKFFAYHDQRNQPDGWCKAANDNAPLLFGTYRGRRVRVTHATPAHRVGITDDVLGKAVTSTEIVRLSDMGDVLPTLYPIRQPPSVAPPAPRPDVPAAPKSNGAQDILRWVALVGNLTVDDLTGTSMKPNVVLARTVAYGMLHATGQRSKMQIAMLMQKDHATIMRNLRRVGLDLGTVGEFDYPFLRAVWAKGALPVGVCVGQIPPAVIERLGALVMVEDGKVEATARYQLLFANREAFACAA